MTLCYQLVKGMWSHVQKHAETLGERAIALFLTSAQCFSTCGIARIKKNTIRLSGFHGQFQVVHINYVHSSQSEQSN